jgi:ribonuclease T1
MTRRTLAIIAGLVFVIAVAVFMPCALTGDCGARDTGSAPAASVSPPATPQPTPTRSPVRAAVDPESGLRWVDLSELPPQASDTMADIRAGGPFRFAKDGTVFRNAERILPVRPRGYYSEFTVVTPGERGRGARRIVTGGPKYGVVRGEFYYTGDHYQSFERIRP